MPDATAPASTPPLAPPDPAAADTWPPDGHPDATWDDAGSDVWPEAAPSPPAVAPPAAAGPADDMAAALASLLALGGAQPPATPPAALPPAVGPTVADVAPALAAHVAARWTLRDGACAHCGGDRWTPSLFATVTLAATPAPGATPLGSFPAAAMTCLGCGAVVLVNLVAAGIVAGAPTRSLDA